MKKLFDYLIVFILLPFIVPLFFIIILLIKYDSKGDIMFRQKRLGKDNSVFDCLKFRTMYTDQKKILENYLKEHPEEVEYYHIYHKYMNDPRITRVGKYLRKFSLDELPQVLNVLKGEMSLVGPRPYMLKESEKLGEDREVILRVKPGITGLWQVNGRNQKTFMERVELDKVYINNHSFWLDIKILFKTILVVLLPKGAK